MSNRADVSKYFVEWFGPTGYMKSMTMKLDADKLTELSPDKSWGLVRGKAIEHYDAKDGDQFDFNTRWTAVMTRGDDGKWRLRAIHFGTNHLDNPGADQGVADAAALCLHRICGMPRAGPRARVVVRPPQRPSQRRDGRVAATSGARMAGSFVAVADAGHRRVVRGCTGGGRIRVSTRASGQRRRHFARWRSVARWRGLGRDHRCRWRVLARGRCADRPVRRRLGACAR